MRRALILLSCALAWACMASQVQAGVIRSTGQEVAKGAGNATQVAASGGAALAGGTMSASHVTANVLQSGMNIAKDGVATAAGTAAAAGTVAGGAAAGTVSGATQAVKGTSSAVASGAAAAAHKVWHAIW